VAQLFVNGATIEGTPAELLEFLQQSEKSEPAPEEPPRYLAKAGDTVKAAEPSQGIELGACYLVLEDTLGNPFIVDDDGDIRREWIKFAHNYDIVDTDASSADVPETLFRVVEGGKYERIDTREVLPGDLIMYLTSPHRDTKAMKLYPVSHKLEYEDEEGDWVVPFGWSRKHMVVVYRQKPSERAFVEGDIVRHTRKWFGRPGIGEVMEPWFDGSKPRVKGVNDAGEDATFFVDPEDLQLIVAAENREDTEGTE